MKALKPSHREKKRYLLFIGRDANPKIIEKEILRFVGILGHSKASPMVIKKSTKSVIISINREAIAEVRASVAASDKDLRIEKVSGTLKKLG